MNVLLKFLKTTPRVYKRLILMFADAALVPVAYVFALVVQREDVGRLAAMSEIWLVLLFLMLTTAALTTFIGLPKIRLNSYDQSGIALHALLAVPVAVIAALLHKIAGTPLPLGTYVVFGLIYFLGCAASRLMMLEFVMAMYRRDAPRRRVLIYGAGTTGMQLARALKAHDSIDAVAFVDDNVALQGLSIAGLPVLRPVDIHDIVSERAVDRVLLAMPSLSHPKLVQMARRLESAGLEVQALPSFSQLVGEEEPLLDKLVKIPAAKLVGRETFNHETSVGCGHVTGRSVLVSGAGGSIGLELCRQVLACKPQRLVLFELSELALYEAERTLGPRAIEAGAELIPVLGSVTEARLARRVLAEHHVDVVIHAAAYKHVPIVERNPLVGLANNVLGTWAMARAAFDAGVERFVLVSSDKAVRPANIMGASKRLAELVVQDLASRSQRTVFTMVRFGNVLGSSGSVVPLFSEQIEKGGPVTITHPEVTRYFMTVEEAVSLVLTASSFARGGEVFVLNMGKPRKLLDLAHQMIHQAGYTVKDEDNPGGDVEVQVIGLRPGDKLHEELIIGEGHVMTAHEKIFVAREAHLSEIEVASVIRGLREAMAAGDDDQARAIAMRWVENGDDQPAQPAGAEPIFVGE
ncbi:polysaccharide biosynthesis protein [Rhodobacteraceae bacterium CCMM004]|nr:polysaccharide biosynthesis protein [Rhodobacteraceae bacterium CCMM004]